MEINKFLLIVVSGKVVPTNLIESLDFITEPTTLFEETSGEWKTLAGTAWAAFGVGFITLVGDFEFSMIVDSQVNNTEAMFGLSTTQVNRKYNDADDWDLAVYNSNDAIKQRTTASASFNLCDIPTSLTWTPGDTLKYKRIGSVITVYYNDNLIHTFPLSYSDDMFMHISAARVSGGSYVSQPTLIIAYSLNDYKVRVLKTGILESLFSAQMSYNILSGSEQSVLIPSGYESGKLYAQKLNTAEIDYIFSRASVANRLNENNLITEELINIPLLDYIESYQKPYLLIEPEVTNYLHYTQDFDNAYFLKVELTVSSNIAIAPDGTLTADKLIPNAAGDLRYTISRITQTIVDFRYTVYAKADGYDWILLTSHNSSTGALRGTYFNVADGTIGTIGTIGQNPLIEDVGNGWYKCSIDEGDSPSSIWTIYVCSVDGDNLFTADGTSGVLIWGGERKELISSYVDVPAGVDVTSAKSVLSRSNLDGLALLSLNFTVTFEGIIMDSKGTNHDFKLFNSSNDSIGIFVSARVININGTEAGITKFDYITTYGLEDVCKLKFEYTGTNLLIYENGSLVSTQPLVIGQLTDFENDAIDNVTKLRVLTLK